MADAAGPRPRITGPGEGNRYDSRDNDAIIKVGVEDTGGAFELVDEICRPGFESRNHKHDTRSQTFYIMEGSGYFNIDGDEFEGEAGTCVHVPAGVPHLVGSKGGMRMLMVFAPGGIEALFSAVRDLPPEKAKDGEFTKGLAEAHDTIMLDAGGKGTVLG